MGVDRMPVKQSSELARLLGGLHRHTGVLDVTIQACLGELADNVLAAAHKRSELQAPNVGAVSNGMLPEHREKVVSWLVQTYAVMNFGEHMLHQTTLTIDRYADGISPKPIPPDEMQRVLLAAISCTLKTSVVDDFARSVREILQHLSRGQVRFSQIMYQELALLDVLGYNVTVPSIMDFVDALLVRASRDLALPPSSPFKDASSSEKGSPHRSSCTSGDDVEFTCAVRDIDARANAKDVFNRDNTLGQMSSFLLELALYEPEMLYAYPQAILAGAALLIASSKLEPPRQKQVAETIVVDLKVLIGRDKDPGSVWQIHLSKAVTRLGELWEQAVAARIVPGQDGALGVHTIFEKYSVPERMSVASLLPPTRRDLQGLISMLEQMPSNVGLESTIVTETEEGQAVGSTEEFCA